MKRLTLNEMKNQLSPEEHYKNYCEMINEIDDNEIDHTDDICPCGDPDCFRPFGHPKDEE